MSPGTAAGQLNTVHNGMMATSLAASAPVSPYVDFSRAAWAALRDATPLPLSEPQLRPLVSLNEQVSLDEVADVYLPVSRLLNLQVAATRTLKAATDTFLGTTRPRIPYIVGVAGSVAVGKSTTARILRALLSRWPSHPTVALVTTDGFLWPTRELEQQGLADRKGFPESYDVRRLVAFLAGVKAGTPGMSAPVYSHLAYDIVPGEVQEVGEPDILIVEGLNVLQGGTTRRGGRTLFVSDFFDFSIYVDASEADIEQWYVERFLTLRDTVFQNPSSHFHRYAGLSRDEAVHTARELWASINLINLRENVQPTRDRARLILEKGRDHAVRRVRLKTV